MHSVLASANALGMRHAVRFRSHAELPHALCPATSLRTSPNPAAPHSSSSSRRSRSLKTEAQHAVNIAAVAPSPLPAAPSQVRTRSPTPSTSTHSDIAYEVVKGALVRYSTLKSGVHPPTVVLVHGILGSRRNLMDFAKMMVEGFPSWQVVLVDLRCHGDSAALPNPPPGPHGVHSAAADVLRLLRSLHLFPHVLIGHSFGGKVVMSMIEQFGGPRLPRPVQAWVLDTLPGTIRAGDADGSNHPASFIRTLLSLPLPIQSRNHLVDHLTAAGFAPHLARWMTTNLRPLDPSAPRSSGLAWSFDLRGVEEMYASYEATCMWPLLKAAPQGLALDFVRAEHSNFRWGASDQQEIEAAGHRVHLLRDSGHWVHTDNPQGLFDILAPSLGTADMHLQRARR